MARHPERQEVVPQPRRSGSLLLEALRGMDLQWPAADFDVAAERHRLATEDPLA